MIIKATPFDSSLIHHAIKRWQTNPSAAFHMIDQVMDGLNRYRWPMRIQPHFVKYRVPDSGFR